MFDLSRIRMEQILFLHKLDIYKLTFLSHLSREQITGLISIHIINLIMTMELVVGFEPTWAKADGLQDRSNQPLWDTSACPRLSEVSFKQLC